MNLMKYSSKNKRPSRRLNKLKFIFMKKCIHILVLVFVLSAVSPVEAKPNISTQDEIILAAYDRAKEIIDLYPPEKYFVINLGMTTTAFSAAFRSMIPNPLDQDMYFRDLPLEELSSSTTAFNSARQFEQLVRKMVPDWVEETGREVVFVRVLQMGATMQFFMKDMVTTNMSRRMGIDFHYHLFMTPGAYSLEALLGKETQNLRVIQDLVLNGLMDEPENRIHSSSLANFGKYNMIYSEVFRERGDDALAENPNYKKLDQRLADLMKRTNRKPYEIPRIEIRLALARCEAAF